MEQNMEAMQNADNGRMVKFEVVCLNIKLLNKMSMCVATQRCKKAKCSFKLKCCLHFTILPYLMFS